jgi:hypothetical protein
MKPRQHWFWRGTVAIVVGTLPYVVFVASSPSPPRLFKMVQRYLGELPTIWLVLVFPGIATAITAYGLLTRFWGAQVTDGETHCRKCGYILRGIPEPRCSECGERI